ncbi:MAG TPA: hypothetical protein VLC28_16165 [Flavitalea sp.]|nr:hypothetical protein [Flavitalea sp.]
MRYLLVAIMFIGFSAQAQDISGIWRGSFRSNNSKMLEILGEDDRYKFEVQLDQKRKEFEGVTYSYKTTVFYGKATCKGTINSSTKKVYLEELKIVEVRMTGSDACIMTCFLQYSKVGTEEFLEGTYTSMNERDSTSCGKGTLFLRKVTTSDFYKEPFLVEKEKSKETKIQPRVATTPPPVPPVKKAAPSTAPKKDIAKQPAKPAPPVSKTPAKPTNPPTTGSVPESSKSNTVIPGPDTLARKIPKVNPVIPLPKVLATRENELVQTIHVDEGNVLVNIYDNGTIDNDTVSVYLDRKLVVSKQRLTEKPITINFDLDPSTSEHELVMVAENLGEIPPNTSLMVVKVNGKQYEVRITSTESKNAVVKFRLKDSP